MLYKRIDHVIKILAKFLNRNTQKEPVGDYITSVEQAKEYFFRWECNTFQMSREGGSLYSSFRKFVPDELEKQWKQEYFGQTVSAIRMANSQSSSVRYNYSNAAGLLSSKRKTKEDIQMLLEATKTIGNSISDSAKTSIVRDIIKEVIPAARHLDLLDEAREFMTLAEGFLIGSEGNVHCDEKLWEEYNKCMNSLKEITTIEQAKEYFISFYCSRDRMKYDFKAIAQSYMNFGAENYEKQWTQEAFERNIKSIEKREYAAKNYPFYHTTVFLFESGICNIANSKMLLEVSKQIKEYEKDYFYYRYAGAIFEHVIPALYKLGLVDEARDFMKLSEDLLNSNSTQFRDRLFHDAVKKYNEWIDKLAAKD